MQTVYLLTKVGEKTFWNRHGVVFEPNKDGSRNMKLDLFQGLTFQIREDSDAKEPKPEATSGRRK